MAKNTFVIVISKHYNRIATHFVTLNTGLNCRL